jgi:hypothetical protein
LLNRYPYCPAAALRQAPFQTAFYTMTADEQPPQEVRNMTIDFEFVGEWESEDMQKAAVKRGLKSRQRRPWPFIPRPHIDQVRGKGFNRGNAGSEDRSADHPDP